MRLGTPHRISPWEAKGESEEDEAEPDELVAEGWMRKMSIPDVGAVHSGEQGAEFVVAGPGDGGGDDAPVEEASRTRLGDAGAGGGCAARSQRRLPREGEEW